MGLRADVIHELSALDTSARAMRKFGLTVGGAFAAITALGVWKHWPAPVCVTLGLIAAALIVPAIAAPSALRGVHRVWMTFALTLGWCMSRLILTLLFLLAVTPMALLGRLISLPFTKMRRVPAQDSYWVDHKSRSATHHKEMF